MVEYEIIEIKESKLIQQVIEVQRLAWQRDDYSLVPPTILRALATHGGKIFGAVTPEQQLIGYVLGFPALSIVDSSKGDKFLYFHSHQIGVIPAFQNFGVGTALKAKQREYCLKMKFPVLTWTYDPLVSTNSQVNFKHLNTISRTYHTDYYGPRNDAYNAQLPTDRMEVELWLIPSIESSLLALKDKILGNVQDQDVSDLWHFNDDPLPSLESVTIDENIESYFIPIPGDFLIAKKSDFEKLLKWRLIIREVYKKLIEKKFVCIDFWRSRDPEIPSTLVWTTSPVFERVSPKFLQIN
ncbi:MAG: hypothetical protein HeimC3_29150 [Candidatus Heimdallarchaeota archaeon LC_3]|nr:MAG: hypothetical protein HeimC3_29150 [Candidatus Heimdallarchaeota archaeon LC_3]